MRVRRLFRCVAVAGCAALALTHTSCTSRVIDAWVSTDQDGTRRPEKAKGSDFVEFGADIRAVYCIVEISNGREDATIEGVLHQDSVTQPDGTENVERDIIVATISQLAPVGAQQRVALALLPKNATGEQDDEIPLSGGAYRCEFALRTRPIPKDEVPVPDVQVQFRIAPTSCPPAQIVSGQECAFFTEGIQCFQAGGRSARKGTAQCTCTSGAWVCDS